MRAKLFILALAMLAFAGCVPDGPDREEGIVLNLFVVEPETRATMPGVDSYNENTIAERLDLFFYNESTLQITKEVSNALRVGTQIKLQTNPNDLEQIFGTQGSGARCGLFVVSNFSGTYQGTPGSRTITEIKNSLLPGPSWEDLPQANFIMTGEKQIRLLNANGATPVYEEVGLSRIAAKVTFDLTVADSAADGENAQNSWIPSKENMAVYMVYPMRKATLSAEPVPMPVTADVTYAAGETVVYAQYIDKVLFDTGTTKSRPRGNGTVNAPVYSPLDNDPDSPNYGKAQPFYSYPMRWETGSAMEPYMKLIIPWTFGNVTRKYYYKIPFHGNEILRNHWYHISIDVQILGTEQADPPEVTIKYAIADWGGAIEEVTEENITTVTSVPATVISARFLNVPTTEYVLFNEDQLIIPIMSSHDVEIVGFTVNNNAYQPAHQVDANFVGSNPRIYNPFTTTVSNNVTAVRPNYSGATTTTVSHAFTASTSNAADAQGWKLKIVGRDSITFSHPLNRDLSSNSYDVAPYTIRFRVRHEGDESGYYSDVTIEQRPSIIIKPDPNSGGRNNYGNVYVNGGHANGANNNNADGTYTSDTQRTVGNPWRFYLGTAGTNLENSGNANENMFVIETSVLPTSGNLSNYVLGDPRSRTVDNLLNNNYEWRKQAASVSGGNRRLTNYYPAGDEAYDNFIAPKIRFASSFAATQKVTYADAKRRCASYQEDGYPAGRWRLPTVAEITYVATLNADGKIVRLLGNTNTNNGATSDYWCNSGYMTVYNGNSTNKPVRGTNYTATETKSVRCVYDEWYWEGTEHATVSKTTFTWGDQLRSEVTMAH